MNRRNFIHCAGMLTAGSLLLLSGSAWAKNTNYKMRLQLFSINTDMNNDPVGTLKAIKAMGYDDCEALGSS